MVLEGQLCTKRALENSHESRDAMDEAPKPEERCLAKLYTALTKSERIMTNRSKDDSDPGSESDDEKERQSGHHGLPGLGI